MTERPRPATILAAVATTAIVTAAMLTGTAGTAAANTRRFHDARNDTGASSDITRVRVEHGSGRGRRLAVEARVGNLAPGDIAYLYVDTRPGNTGPEYLAYLVANSDVFGLQRVPNFNRDGRRVDCRGLRGHADGYGPDVVRFSVPRACLHTPPRVRVHVKLRFDNAFQVIVDRAPGRKRFFGWVLR